jgi:hypothetical protein
MRRKDTNAYQDDSGHQPILLFMTAYSDTNSDVPHVVGVIYSKSSGPVAPDAACYEKYTVSPDGLTFERTGYTDMTTVNSGTWMIDSDGANEAKLFSDLSTVDVYYEVVKTGQGAIPIGAGARCYTIRYDNGESREVVFGDGSIYDNAGLIRTPIDDYLSSVILPADASNKYKQCIG